MTKFAYFVEYSFFMKTLLHIPGSWITGYFTRSLEHLTLNGQETPLSHYPAFLEVAADCHKLVNLYRHTDGTWMENFAAEVETGLISVLIYCAGIYSIV